MEKWDTADTVAKEFSVGRPLDSGAPLSGTTEHELPDLAKTDNLRKDGQLSQTGYDAPTSAWTSTLLDGVNAAALALMAGVS